jgi:hypothetical protein
MTDLVSLLQALLFIRKSLSPPSHIFTVLVTIK